MIDYKKAAQSCRNVATKIRTGELTPGLKTPWIDKGFGEDGKLIVTSRCAMGLLVFDYVGLEPGTLVPWQFVGPIHEELTKGLPQGNLWLGVTTPNDAGNFPGAADGLDKIAEFFESRA